MGGTWDDMFDELELRARPMLDAGWRLVSTEQEESWEHGDSVFYDVTEPFFSIYDSTADSALEAFREHGWV